MPSADFRGDRERTAARRGLATALVGVTILLAAGILEGGYRAAGEPLSPRLPSFGIEYLWVSPAGLLLFTLPVIAVVSLIRAIRPGWLTPAAAVFCVAVPAAGTVSLFLLRERMPDLVHLILAVGVATTLMRAAKGRERSVERLAAWGLPALAIVPLAAFGATVWRDVREPRALATLPTAPAGARNILLIVWDTVRERQLSLYGYPKLTTPNLDRRATAGLVFNRAYAPAPWTLPTHAAIFTGFLPQHLKLDWVTPLGDDMPTLAEVLTGLGYRTGGFSANTIAATRATGLARGFVRYEDWPLALRYRLLVSHSTLVRVVRRYPPLNRIPALRLPWKDATEVTTHFLRWLDTTAGTNRPFFGFLNYFNAHGPYLSPRPLRQRFGGDTQEHRYDASIAHLDAELERVFQGLEERGLLESTVVVLTSDHGEAFGDHDLWGHALSVYIEQLHVPLVIWAPQRVPAARVDAPAGLRELGNTMLDLALDPAPLNVLQGRSLARLWESEPAAPDTIVAGVLQAVNDPGINPATSGPALSVIADRFHYLVDGKGVDQLFDLSTDPRELTNLVAQDSLQPVVHRLRAYILEHFDSTWTAKVPRPEP